MHWKGGRFHPPVAVDNSNLICQPSETKMFYPMSFYLRLISAGGDVGRQAVENFVGKETVVLIHGIPGPNPFILFQESLYDF
jgi:hypothetical protein